ncbi:hypothetical protein HK105_201605 [Polyrhizophydium stewartii]|uniref:Uncharacterized protein n=1 Tax=Polyrhizophydium stewartii TaxID=2732419 RepID=A0ABR4NGX8_9FUNG
MAERQLERALQLFELDVEKALRAWRPLADDGLALLNELSNDRLGRHQRQLAALSEFEDAVAMLERPPDPAAGKAAETLASKIADVMARLTVQVEAMEAAVAKADIAIHQVRPLLLSQQPRPATDVGAQGSPARHRQDGAQSQQQSLSGQDILDIQMERYLALTTLVAQYAEDLSLKRHIAEWIQTGPILRDAMMLCLSLWLHAPLVDDGPTD